MFIKLFAFSDFGCETMLTFIRSLLYHPQLKYQKMKMQLKVRDLSFVLSLFVIIIVSIYLVYDRIKEGTINNYLDVLGQRVLTMVPEGPQRELISAYYEKFKEDVEEKRIGPEKVEAFASRMLNLSYADTIVDPNQIVQALQMHTDFSKPYYIQSPQMPGLPDSIEVVAVIEPNKPSTLFPEFRKWQQMEVRLKAILALEENLKKQNEKQEAMEESINIRIDENMRIILGNEKRELLNADESRALSEELKQLEKLKLIKWKEAEELQKEKLLIQIQVDSIVQGIDQQKE